jgi:DNA recombination protein RmuC
MEILTAVALALLIVVIGLQLVLLRREPKIAFDTAALQAQLQSVERAQERVERSVRDELGRNREELTRDSHNQRQEMQSALAAFGSGVTADIAALGKAQQAQLDVVTQHMDAHSQASDDRLAAIRDALESRLHSLLESIGQALADLNREERRDAGLAVQQLAANKEALERSLGEFRSLLEARLSSAFAEQLQRIDQLRSESGTAAQQNRTEANDALATFNDSIVGAVTAMGSAQSAQIAQLTNTTDGKLEAIRTTIDGRMKGYQDDSAGKLEQVRAELSANVQAIRMEVGERLKGFNDSVVKSVSELGTAQSAHIGRLTDTTDQKLEAVRASVEDRLKSIQDENAAKLEQIRHTVDEQLQSALEKRLGDSFKLVSDRLEQVHRGLGEMQNLASGVGDLKKLLSNVRVRGTWGEVQLGMLLEQVLTPDQYGVNVATTGTNERVEFAIRLPGGEEGQPLWLPIDAKFPKEDYERLLDAVERADSAAIEDSSRQLELRIRQCAKDITQKYVLPPKTTDFAIMYLPSEGLYAEVLRRPGLIESLQHDYRVTAAGPVTLAATLNSLQMGFRTLAIQKRSSEVWQVLGGVKAEFGKYSEILAKVHKKLQESNNIVEQGLTRTRAIEKKLRKVQEVDTGESIDLLEAGEESEEAAVASGVK